MADAETAFRRLLRFQLVVIAVFVLLVAIGATVAYLVLRDDHAKTTVVPDIRGFDSVAAASTLDRAGLAPGYISFERASDTVTVGRVIDTQPPPGTKVTRGAVIKVTVSCGRVQPGFCNA
jgi:beta-lactam-binding protein with PASTA domain